MRGSARNYRERLKLAVTGALFLGIVGTGYVGGAVETQISSPPMSFKMEGVTVEAKRPDWEQKLSPGTVTVSVRNNIKVNRKAYRICLKMFQGYMYGR